MIVEITGSFLFLFRPIPVDSDVFRRVLLRILLRFIDHLIKVGIRHLVIVLSGNCFAIAEPFAHGMDG